MYYHNYNRCIFLCVRSVFVFPFILLGCCFIPLCMPSMKDVEHSCPNCNNILGHYRRSGGLQAAVGHIPQMQIYTCWTHAGNILLSCWAHTVSVDQHFLDTHRIYNAQLLYIYIYTLWYVYNSKLKIYSHRVFFILSYRKSEFIKKKLPLII